MSEKLTKGQLQGYPRKIKGICEECGQSFIAEAMREDDMIVWRGYCQYCGELLDLEEPMLDMDEETLEREFAEYLLKKEART